MDLEHVFLASGARTGFGCNRPSHRGVLEGVGVADGATSASDFDEFYAGSARRVIHHVYALCGDLAEAQDVTQEAYTRAWLRWSTVSRYEDPEGWVRLVAFRLLANRFRSLRRWLAARSRMGEPPH